MDPYKIQGPAVVSFSGGRTSAYMLRKILDAHENALPQDVHAVFADTGKERAETYAFVQACRDHWSVRIDRVAMDAPDGVPPFEHMIRSRKYLPNPIHRICTQHLKIEPIHKFAKAQGYDEWTAVIGFRADEARRVAKARANERSPHENKVFPLYAAGINKSDVLAFWKAQPFNLQLEPHESNCDLCFLKGAAIRTHIMQDHPELAQWWIDMEQFVGATFNKDGPSYARLDQFARKQTRLPLLDADDSLPCACTD